MQDKSLQEKLNYIQTNLDVPKNHINNFGGYKYRSCEDILAALKPLLKETGAILTINDDISEVGERIYVKATALLQSNQEVATTTAYARESFTKRGMDDSQITGSASSYARKYALNGLFCIDDGKDFDELNHHDYEKKADRTTAKGEKIPKASLKQAKQIKDLLIKYALVDDSKQDVLIFVNNWLEGRGGNPIEAANQLTESEARQLIDELYDLDDNLDMSPPPEMNIDPPITSQQRKKLQVELANINITEKSDRLSWMNDLLASKKIDKVVESTNDLTKDEAKMMIDYLVKGDNK